MISPRILLLATLLLATYCQCAPKVIREEMGRQFDFPDSENIPEPETSRPSRNFIQRIFEMVKQWFGMENRTTIVRQDGTVEEVEGPSGGDSMLARFGRRLIGLVGNILRMVSGGDSPLPLPGLGELRYNRRQPDLRLNEIETMRLQQT